MSHFSARCGDHLSDGPAPRGHFGGVGGVLTLLEPCAEYPPHDDSPLASGACSSCPVVVPSSDLSGRNGFDIGVGAAGGVGGLLGGPNDGVPSRAPMTDQPSVFHAAHGSCSPCGGALSGKAAGSCAGIAGNGLKSSGLLQR